MKHRTMKERMTFVPLGITLLLTLTLAACGGSGGAADNTAVPPSATAKSVVGKITAFGSVYVNGVEYDTNG
ncbi:MAG: hypothetical protein QNK34_02140, partial [Woeseiaceae bacterium]|nr:hypothetical protein [Woeseiaceae bacterium]